MRQIDADLLQEELENEIELSKRKGERGITSGLRIAARRVKHAPTIDAVPVVRCEICMSRRTFECPMYSETDGSDYGLGIIINDRTDDDGYCHCGARMDGDPHDSGQ